MARATQVGNRRLRLAAVFGCLLAIPRMYRVQQPPPAALPAPTTTVSRPKIKTFTR